MSLSVRTMLNPKSHLHEVDQYVVLLVYSFYTGCFQKCAVFSPCAYIMYARGKRQETFSAVIRIGCAYLNIIPDLMLETSSCILRFSNLRLPKNYPIFR